VELEARGGNLRVSNAIQEYKHCDSGDSSSRISHQKGIIGIFFPFFPLVDVSAGDLLGSF